MSTLSVDTEKNKDKLDQIIKNNNGNKMIEVSNEEFYDDDYFDSDLTDDDDGDYDDSSNNRNKNFKGTMSNLKKTRKEYRKVLTNDELFYDPDVDDVNELWMQRKLSKHNKTSSDQKTSTTTSTNETDAILSCPMCFTILSYQTQKHELYSNQYRAIFVENCKVNYLEKLVYKEDMESKKSKKKINKQNKAIDDEKVDKSTQISELNNSNNSSTMTNNNSTIEEIYYPVECLNCGTKVAVMDVEEVFHFFNAIPS